MTREEVIDRIRWWAREGCRYRYPPSLARWCAGPRAGLRRKAMDQAEDGFITQPNKDALSRGTALLTCGRIWRIRMKTRNIRLRLCMQTVVPHFCLVRTIAKQWCDTLVGWKSMELTEYFSSALACQSRNQGVWTIATRSHPTCRLEQIYMGVRGRWCTISRECNPVRSKSG